MNKTSIEWVKNPDGSQGYTWNPITGCLNGCEYCYARKLANTRLKERYLTNTTTVAHYADGNYTVERKRTDPFYPRFWADRMWLYELVGSKKKPKGIFVCDMSDLFGIGVPESWTRRVLEVISMHPRHRFYLLTKQPQNLIKFSPFPDNAWVGISVTHSAMYVEAMNRLDGICAEVKYISFEPLLDWRIDPVILAEDFVNQQLDWVIIGAQTKPYKPPKIEWVREIVEACDKAGIPVFLKDNLKSLFKERNKLFHRWKEKDTDVDPFGYGATTNYELALRQEMPSA